MEFHFGCAQTRASRRTWCFAARGLAKDRAHPGPPTPCRVASECMDTPEVERMTSLELVAPTPMTHGVVVLCQLSYIRKRCKACRRPVPGLPCGNLLKSVHRKRWCDPSIAGLRRCASLLKSETKEARILSESGPLRTELGRWLNYLSSAHPSPGCTWSSACASQPNVRPWLLVVHGPWALFEATPKPPRTNAPRPRMGRCVLMT